MHLITLNEPRRSTGSEENTPLSTIDGVWNSISAAKTCTVLVGANALATEGLDDIMSDSSIQAFSAAETEASDSTPNTNIDKTASSMYSKVSGFCGKLAKVQLSPLHDLVEYLVGTEKLAYLYTTSVQTSTLCVDSSMHASELESRVVYINGSITKFVCKACTAKHDLTQAVLFKAMCGRNLQCGVCQFQGHLTKSNNDKSAAFILDVFAAKDNTEIVTSAISADRESSLDLVLAIGIDDGSNYWSGIIAQIVQTNTKLIVISDHGKLPCKIPSSLERSAYVVCCSPDDFGCAWAKANTTNSSGNNESETAGSITESIQNNENSNEPSIVSKSSDAGLVKSGVGVANQKSIHYGRGQQVSAESSDETNKDTQDSNSNSRCSSSNGRHNKSNKGAKGRTNKEKVSLNHLLNFTLPVRDTSPLPLVRPRRRNADLVHSERQAQVNKRTFINANFRFALNPGYFSNLSPIATRPDMQLKWEWIERIIMPVTNDNVNCPICLESPVSARITKCGHVYCLPCILRYLSIENDTNSGTSGPKKCPICWEPVVINDLLPVHPWATRYNIDLSDRPAKTSPTNNSKHSTHIVSMQLMKRLRGSTICLPRMVTSKLFPNGLHEFVKDSEDTSQVNCSTNSKLQFDSNHFPWTFTEHAFPFAKFLLADSDYCKAEFQREMDDLKREKESESSINDPESQVFIESAIMQLEHSMKEHESSSESSLKIEGHARAFHNGSDKDTQLQTTNSAEHSSDKQSEHSSGDSDSNKNADDFFYFYQADDGQHIYMHPLHIRVLAHEYGGYSNLPDKLDIKLRHSVESTITDEVRRRFRFLDHLSLRCDVTFVEPELKTLVSHRSIDKFRVQLAQREKQHAARVRQIAIDEARSDAMAAVAAAASSDTSIRYRSEWSRDGHNRYGDFTQASTGYTGTKPDDTSFPALGTSESTNGNNESSSDFPSLSTTKNKAVWPHEPLPPSAASIEYSEIWDEFERSTLGRRPEYESDEDNYDDEHDYNDKFYKFSESQGVDAKPSQVKVPKKSKKKNSRLKLVLSGSAAPRRR